MIGSKSKYFHQPEEELLIGQARLFSYLKEVWNYDQDQLKVYLNAYCYFMKNPDQFDGATIVKDLYHIPGLDINAMLHDYHYVRYNVASNLYVKWHCDWLYAKQMEKLGKGFLSWVHWAGLKITGLPFCIYTNFKKGSINQTQETDFFREYELLIKNHRL